MVNVKIFHILLTYSYFPKCNCSFDSMIIGIFNIIFLLDLIGLRVFFGILGKFSITMSFNSIYTWSTEIYPTVIR